MSFFRSVATIIVSQECKVELLSSHISCNIFLTKLTYLLIIKLAQQESLCCSVEKAPNRYLGGPGFEFCRGL